MHRILVDSDVILDLFLDREPHHAIALHFFSYLERNSAAVAAFASPVAIANVAYILTKVRSQSYAVRKIAQLRRILGIASIDETVVDQAIDRPHLDFEDSVQYHCAHVARLNAIVTRNVGDYIVGDIPIVTPEELLAILASGESV